MELAPGGKTASRMTMHSVPVRITSQRDPLRGEKRQMGQHVVLSNSKTNNSIFQHSRTSIYGVYGFLQGPNPQESPMSTQLGNELAPLLFKGEGKASGA